MKEKMNAAQAKQFRIDEYLARLGFLPKRRGDKRMMYTSMLATGADSTPSFEVSADGHAFHDWSTGAKGSIVDLAMSLLHTSSVSVALAHIARTMGRPAQVAPCCTNSFSFHQQKSFELLSVGELTSLPLLYYGRERGITLPVMKMYCSEVHYRASQNREYYAIGFQNKSGGWELRNKYSKVAAAPKDITVMNDLCGCTMLLFEGFFDFLSAATMNWFRPQLMNAVILNSTALLDRALPILNEASRVICLLDNDPSGQEATEHIMQACPHAEDHSNLYASSNDLNDFLMNKSKINKR